MCSSSTASRRWALKSSNCWGRSGSGADHPPTCKTHKRTSFTSQTHHVPHSDEANLVNESDKRVNLDVLSCFKSLHQSGGWTSGTRPWSPLGCFSSLCTSAACQRKENVVNGVCFIRSRHLPSHFQGLPGTPVTWRFHWGPKTRSGRGPAL